MEKIPYLLALDLGIASIGWAILGLDDEGRPSRIIRLGTHLFDSGNVGDFKRGKDEPPGKPRRDARQVRKMIWRRARRKRKLLRLLQAANLLPPGDVSIPAAIDAYIRGIDAQLASTWNRNATHREYQLMPYRIRAAGIDRDLSRIEFGRAIYHLAQRRGFLSNRKSKEKPDEKSDVKSGISELAQEMERARARTLGEYFASIDPEQVRVRRRWTSRGMYTSEFDQLWGRQAATLGLTEEQRIAIRDAIFYQRPLKSSDHLVGRCRYLSRFRRAPVACRLAQRFRLLQKVNDLRLVDDLQNERPLEPAQRAAVLDALACAESVPLTKLRKVIAAPKGMTFNFETEGEKNLPGHRTDARLCKVVAGYAGWPDERKTALVDELLGKMEDDPLRRRIAEAYKLDAATVSALFEDAALEDGFVGLSREAMRRLMPHMEAGESYMTAALLLFSDSFEPAEPLDRLPPVLKYDADLRNPTVLRGLTEIRKLVNLIIKRYGKPQRVHIELLRELKKSRKAREEIAAQNLARRKQREQAARAILRDAGLPRASARDIEKWLLADECGWHCPYTDKPINVHTLFVEPQFEIEHIWPYERSLDDSFANKTLCQRDANREKGKRLPSEAFSEQRLNEIVARVARFDGNDMRNEKLRRFKATEIPEGFTNRQLNDSSHLARAASRYLGLLYGGVDDASGHKRVHTRVGGLTAQLRRLWGLNQILSGTDQKTRDDHRHHAIDAVVVGCADTCTVQEMMRVASEQITWGRSRISDLLLPWTSFIRDLEDAIDRVVVSHRQCRRIGGALHGESNYSHRKTLNGQEMRTIRKPITMLKESDIPKIVDKRIREAVATAFRVSGEKTPERAFAEERFPTWTSRSGRTQPIKRVTLATNANPMTVGRGERARYVDSTEGSNHHARIIAKLNPDGTEKNWRDEIVTRFDMYGRKADDKLKLGVDRSVGIDERFKFSLAANEYIELDVPGPDRKPTNRRATYRVVNISAGKIMCVLHTDGRPRDKRKTTGDDWSPGGAGLFKHHARKVFVNYLGEVKNAGG